MKPISPESLSKKVVRGGMWVFGLRITNRGLGFIRTIILARLLAPSDFGLLGIAMLAISTLETFSQTGFQAALIQKKENVESYLDTAWTVSAIRGILLFLILFLSAPLVATFFNSPQATLVIKVIAVSTLLSGFRNIGILFFQKELEFNKQFIYELSATLVDLTIAIILAFILRNVWALVWGGLAANFVRLFMSYILHPYRPHVRLNKGEFKELFGFGKWVLGSSILVFIGAYIDDIFVGKMLGATALGFYQMAYRISSMPATEITYVIASVAFPAYSKVQDSQVMLQQAYFRIMRLTVAISIPMAVGIVFLAPEFINIFLGEKWISIVPAMRLLAVAALIKSVISTGSPLFIGSGYPNFEFYMQLIRALIIIIAIYPLTIYMGISGAALCVILSIAGMLIVWYPFSQNITKASWDNYANILWPPLFCSLFMAGGIYIATLYWNPIQQPLILSMLTFIGIGMSSIFIYIAGMYILQRYYPSYDVMEEVKLLYKSLIGK
jgi:O-antigen/teichoic acid export membrane protein